jgi:hypothetical protein
MIMPLLLDYRWNSFVVAAMVMLGSFASDIATVKVRGGWWNNNVHVGTIPAAYHSISSRYQHSETMLMKEWELHQKTAGPSR